MKIYEGDNVLIISGKDRARKGKVVRVFDKIGKVIVEGINIRRKHVKAKKSGEKGQKIESPAPISVSNVKLICPKCGKATKVEYKIIKDSKNRICKKCSAEIPKAKK